MAGCAGCGGPTLVDKRLGTPRKWCSDDRCRKRHWEKEHGRGVCACGAQLAPRSLYHGTQQCKVCRQQSMREERERRRQRIADAYLAGASLVEIANALGTTSNAIGVALAGMRRDGWDLPYRRPGFRRQEAA